MRRLLPGAQAMAGPMPYPAVKLSLPGWIETALPDAKRVYPDIAARMDVVIELSRRNVDARTGGPFGAAIFEMHSGRLVAPGVNRVIPGNCSVAHAETLAIMTAQAILGTYDLGADGLPPMELVSSTEPCAMCLGAVVWSGVRRLVCGVWCVVPGKRMPGASASMKAPNRTIGWVPWNPGESPWCATWGA